MMGEKETEAIRLILKRMAIDDEYEWCCKAEEILDEVREPIAMRKSELRPAEF